MKNYSLFFRLACLLVFLLPVCTTAQEPPPAAASTTFLRFRIGVAGSADQCFRTLRPANGRDDITRGRNDEEIPRFGYTAGVALAYHFSPILALESGVYYADRGYQRDPFENPDYQPGDIFPRYAEMIYRFHCIDIPLRLNLVMGDSKVRVVTGLGLTTNVLVMATETRNIDYVTFQSNSVVESDYDYRQVTLSATLSLGIDYRFSPRMHLRVEPTVRHGVLAILEDPVREYLYSGGVLVGWMVEI